MLASLDVRVPYLDEMILDRILPLPSSKKMPNGELKALLMPIARRLLPREVWDRPKHGFTILSQCRDLPEHGGLPSKRYWIGEKKMSHFLTIPIFAGFTK